jgi:hypothetical protein
MNKEKIIADLELAKDLVKLYAQLGQFYMDNGYKVKAYQKRNEALAQQSAVISLEKLLKAI